MSTTRSRWWLSGLVCQAVCAALSVAPVAMAAEADGVVSGRDALLARENKRIQQVMAWAAQAKPSQKELLLKIYEPVVEGNKKDYARNLEYAKKYREKADDAARSMKDKDAKYYESVAQLLEYYAKQNKAVVEAILGGKGAAMEAALAEIRKVEDRFAKLTGQAYQREWLMPSETKARAAAATETPGATGATAGHPQQQGQAPARK